MGIPRTSSKRRWAEDDDEENAPSKTLCTSPPHGLCPEDVLRSPPSMQEAQQQSSILSDEDDTPLETLTKLSEDEDESFEDDEEDKDSGFIDGNSADNSSDEEAGGSEGVQPPTDKAQPSFISSYLPPSKPIGSSTPKRDAGDPPHPSPYQGFVASFDFASYSTECYPVPQKSNWSCSFYDGGTSSPQSCNKFMEISSSSPRSTSSQSIQCDENGKSYIELGSAAPFSTFGESYTQVNYSTSSPPYSSPYPCHSGYSNYYNESRQPQGGASTPYNAYLNSDSYCNYESEGRNIPSYSPSSYSSSDFCPRTISGSPSRCPSPFCGSDSKTSAYRGSSCYQQQRLLVLNMSMCKLSRFSRFPEPNLHRSVLICNTLRHIEKELESEGVCISTILAQGANRHSFGPQHSASNQQQFTEHMPSNSFTPEPPLPSIHSPSQFGSQFNSSQQHFGSSFFGQDDHVTPSSFEAPTEPRRFSLPPSEGCQNDNGACDTSAAQNSSDDYNEGINWCSVLSLSSQSDLDNINNNEYSAWGMDIGDEASGSIVSQDTKIGVPFVTPDDVLRSECNASRIEDSFILVDS